MYVYNDSNYESDEISQCKFTLMIEIIRLIIALYHMFEIIRQYKFHNNISNHLNLN